MITYTYIYSIYIYMCVCVSENGVYHPNGHLIGALKKSALSHWILGVPHFQIKPYVNICTLW